nr:phosphopantothenoylcysteine decarboxylase [uncultured Maricaulis sp.]
MTEPLTGRHVLITAGPTREPIDPVRFISNHSSGRQGYAIAAACAALGARVTLVAGPTALPDPDGVETIHIETARDMLAAVETALPADVFIAVAAVADWRPAEPADRKLKLDKASFSSLPLVENPDILKTISQLKAGRPGLVIGFAAETHDVEALAIAKRKRKGCDWIVANDVSGDVMGGAENAVLLVTEAGSEAWDRAEKGRIAEQLAARIATALG